MSRRAIIAVKLGAHLLCLAPLIWLGRLCTSPAIALKPDPVKFIIHFTGDWAIYMLLASLFMLFAGTARASWLIRFHRLCGLYAFFWATLHLMTYVCIYSGYDFVGAFAAFHTGHAGALFTEWSTVFPGILHDLSKRPFIDVGLLAWVILLVWAVTSPGFVQHALHGKKKAHLHRVIYAGDSCKAER